jgi:hypothetical protein
MVSLLLGAHGCGAARGGPVHPHQLEAEVLDAFKELVEASKALDADRYFECFDKERFTGLNADGTVWHSIEDLERLVSPGFAQVERVISLEFQNVKVTIINPSTAILVNEYKETSLLKDGHTVEQSGGGTQVWAKSKNAWKLVSVSASETRR